MSNLISKEEIHELMMNGRHCSQVVFGQWAEDLGLDKDTAIKIISAFGGGACHGEICGAISGGLAAIGTKYGTCKFNDPDQDVIMKETSEEFIRRFKEKYGTVLCRDLLKEYDIDFARPGDRQKAKETGVPKQVCPEYVHGALEILEEMMVK